MKSRSLENSAKAQLCYPRQNPVKSRVRCTEQMKILYSFLPVWGRVMCQLSGSSCENWQTVRGKKNAGRAWSLKLRLQIIVSASPGNLRGNANSQPHPLHTYQSKIAGVAPLSQVPTSPPGDSDSDACSCSRVY